MKKLVYQYIPTVLEKKSSNIIKILFLIMGLFIYEFGYGQTTLVTQGFEVGSDAAPANWSEEIISGTANLYFNVVGSTYPAGFIADEGSDFVRFNSYTCSSGNQARLKQTSSFSTSGYSSITVEFAWTKDNAYSTSDDYVRVQYSTDGSSWTTAGASNITRYQASGDSWTNQSVTLPVGAENQATLYIAFLFTSQYGNDCHLDDVVVKGTPSCTAPGTQATSFSSNTLAATSMNITFTRGNGDGGVLVVARAGGTVDADPVSGTTYTAGAFGAGDEIGTGNWVVYKGVANGASVASGNIPITGLTANTTYYYAIYEYNASGTCFHLTELTGNSTTTNPKTLGAIVYNQASTAVLGSNSTNNEILRIDFPVTGTTGTLNLNSIELNFVGNDVADIASSGVKLYRTTTTTFATTNQLGSSVSFSGGVATFSGLAYDLPNGTTYVWICYDIASTAVADGTHTVDASIGINKIDVASTTYPVALQSPAGTRTIQDMTYTSSNVVQVTGNVSQNTDDNQVIRIEVVAGGGTSNPLEVTGFTVNANGSTAPVSDNIENAKIYYTGTSSTFSTSNKFGPTIITPTTTSFNIDGDVQELQIGTNYFWLTYDVKSTAAIGEVIDGECTAITIGTTKSPTGNPAANNRPIIAATNPYCSATTTTTCAGSAYISRVQLNTIDQASACDAGDGYTDYSAVSTTLYKGTSYTLTITLASGLSSDRGAVWVDWNQDGDFWDSNEQITMTTSSGAGPTYTASVVPPEDATIGSARLRIRISNSYYPYSCGVIDLGECEDYTVNIQSPSVPAYAKFYDYGGNEQICFNNIKYDDATPTFRVSAICSGNMNRFSIEVDDDPAFGSINATQNFDAVYTSETEYNLNFTALTPVNNTTYYCRVRARDQATSTYSSYSSERWSFTYSTATTTPEWHQKTDTQFGTSTDYDGVRFSSGVSSPTAITERGFETVATWTYDETGETDFDGAQSTNYPTEGTNTYRLRYDGGGTINAGNNCDLYKTIDFTDFKTIYADFYINSSNNTNNLYGLVCFDGTFPDVGATIGWAARIISDNNGAYLHTDIDVSGLTGNHSLRFGLYCDVNFNAGTKEFYVDNITVNRYLYSKPVYLASFENASAWEQMEWAEAGANGNLSITIQKMVSGEWENVYGMENISTSPIDISSLGGEPAIRLLGNFTNTGTGSPTMSSWTIKCAISPVEPPTSFTGVSVSSSEIDLTWTENVAGNAVMVAYNTVNTFGTPEDGTIYANGDYLPDSAGIVIYQGNAEAFDFTSISGAGCKYYFKAWSVNVSNIYSQGVETEVENSIGSVSVFPYLETFEGYDNWSEDICPWSINDADNLEVWGIGSYVYPPKYGPTSFYIFNPWQTSPTVEIRAAPYSGKKFACSFSPISALTDDWLISPQFELDPIVNYELSFWAKSFEGSSITAEEWNSLEVKISTTGTSTADFTTTIVPSTVIEYDWEEIVYDLAAYSGQDIYIAIHNISNDKYFLMIDDFRIGIICSDPVADAGTDQTICGGNATLAGNAPDAGVTGAWSVESGSATFTDYTSPTTTVTGIGTGTTILAWTLTVTNGGCTHTDNITITNSPPTADAGIAQTVCALPTLAGSVPAGGEEGTWSVISGTATFADENSNTTAVTAMGVGDNLLQWTVNNIADPTCSTYDQVLITYLPTPDAPSVTMASSVTDISFVANWTAVSPVDHYELDVSTASDFSSFVVGYNDLNVGNVTSYSVTGLTANTQYYYRVRAVNSCGSASISSDPPYSVTTPTAPLPDEGLILDMNLTNDGTLYQTDDANYFIMRGIGYSILGSGIYTDAKLRVQGQITFDAVIASGLFSKTLTDGTGGITFTIYDARTYKNGEFTNNATTTTNNTSVFENSGHWTNNGTFTANAVSRVVFNGTANQNVKSGTGPYYDVTLNNTSAAAALTLSDNATIANELKLTDGWIVTGANYVIMSSTTQADLVLDFDDGRTFINKNLRRAIPNPIAGASTYVFPLGNGNATTNYYRGDLSSSDLSGATYVTGSCTSITEAGNNIDSRISVSEGATTYNDLVNTGVWDFTPSGATGGSYNLKLYVTNIAGLTNDKFAILKRPTGSTDYADWVTGSPAAYPASGAMGRIISGGSAPYYAERTGYTSFTEYGIGKTVDPLPVVLLSLTAKCQNSILLEWSTASEINSSYFIIERSYDGVIFNYLDKVDASGNSNVVSNYSFIDSKFDYTLMYYRLKQVDFNGDYYYSDIISTNCISSNELFDIFKSNDDGLNFIIKNGVPEKDYKLMIYDQVGKCLVTKNVKLNSSIQKVSIDENLSIGIYNIVIRSADDFICKQFVIYSK